MSEDENPKEESIFTRSRRSYVYESGNRGPSTINRRAILIVVGISILVLLVIIAVFASGKKGEQEKTAPIPTPTEIPFPTEEPTPTPNKGTPTPTAKASPTPKPTLSPTKTATSTIDKATGLDRANLTIAIQNGSGIAGAATKASNFLKGLGYNVSSTGNADNFDYENTVIEVKSTKKAYLDLLKKDLSSNYSIGSTSAAFTGSSDAVVIVGKK